MQLIIFAVALFISILSTRWIRDFAVAHNLVSAPASSRHMHIRPVPRLGGVAIFVTLWAMVLLARCVPGHFNVPVISSHISIGILGPATIIFLLGLIDDLRGLTAYTKFSVQAAAAVLLYLNGFGISHLPIRGAGLNFGWPLGLPLTIIWVLWITNAFNLIDGLDGLAAGSALFSTLVTCVVALLNHNQIILFLTLALAGAILGLLRYNFNPATIFLGDCGSLLIGFLLSAIALAGSQKSPTMVAVAIPIVSLGLPILDVAVSVVRRFLSGKGLFSADREHIHHKLISLGVSHRKAVLLLYLVSACFALLSLFLLNPGGEAIAMVLVVVGVGVLVGLQQLRYHEFFELGWIANRALNQRQIIAHNVSIRRTADTLKFCADPENLCRILRECLEPIGFDGFALHLDSRTSAMAPVSPPQNSGELYRFWNHTANVSNANWTLSFCLVQKNGAEKGEFRLYRKLSRDPIWLDLNVFTTSGFQTALADCVARISSQEGSKQSDPSPLTVSISAAAGE